MQLSGYSFPKPPGLDGIFAALADPTRRAILARLAQGEASVKELAELFAASQPAVSKHLKVLERAGLISRDRHAQPRLSRLDNLLEEIQCSTPNPSKSRRPLTAKS